jgi:hypothetical protein
MTIRITRRHHIKNSVRHFMRGNRHQDAPVILQRSCVGNCYDASSPNEEWRRASL